MKLALLAALVITPFPLEQVQLVAGADGSVFLAGVQSIDAQDQRLPAPLPSVRTAPPGGAFGAPQVLQGTAVGVDATGTPTTVAGKELAVAPSGAAVVAWLDGSTLRAAVREPGGAFGATTTVARRVARGSRITVAIGSRGDALLVWTRSEEYYKPGFAALRRPGGGFSAPKRISKHIGDIRAAVGEDGTAVAAFTQERRGGRTETRVLTNLRRPQTLPCDGVAALAVSTRTLVLCGNALQVWEGRGRLRRTGRLDARRGPAEVAVDFAPDGRAVATWATRTRAVPAAYRVVVAERAPGGAFGPPEFITEQYAEVVPVAAKLTPGGGWTVISRTFGQGGRSMLASRK